MTITVTERDLRALLSVVRDHRDEDPGDGLPLSLLQHLMAEIPSDAVSFMGLDSVRQEAWFGQGFRRIARTRRMTRKRSGPTTRTACPARIRTAPATCSASPGTPISTARVSGIPPGCTPTTCARPGWKTN
jgi:hypothetical protein